MGSSLTQSPSGAGPVISLRQVAEAAGVSRMTVSRAFKPDASVKPELRTRVLAVARELGYEPDRMVTELMTSFVQRRPVNYRETIAALWWPERWVNRDAPLGFGAAVRLGIEAGAKRHGCKVEHVVLSPSLKVRALQRMLTARGINGLIVTPPPMADMAAPALDWGKFAAVSIGTSLREPQLHRAQVAHYSAMVRMLERLRERGCQRPCLVLRIDLEERMQRAYTAAFLAWDSEGPTEAAGRIWHAESPQSPKLETWLTRINSDVVIADTDGWRQVLPAKWAKSRFVSLAVDDPKGEVSGHHQNITRVAEAAVDLLVQARLRHETGVPTEPLIMLTTGFWVEGNSLAAARAVSS